MVGQYNVSNCLAAFGATVFGLGIAPDIAAEGIANLPGIPGRMEMINMGQDFTAIVDFAHTPNALKVTLETAREMLNNGGGEEEKSCDSCFWLGWAERQGKASHDGRDFCRVGRFHGIDR